MMKIILIFLTKDFCGASFPSLLSFDWMEFANRSTTEQKVGGIRAARLRRTFREHPP